MNELQEKVGTIPSGPRAGEPLPVNKRTVGDSIIKELQEQGAKEATGLAASRSRALKLAGVGLAGVSVLGTAASAAETTERTNIARQTNNPMDWVQAGLSGLSLATDFIPVAGELVSTPADAANLMIDQHRAGGSQMKGSGRGGGVRKATVGENKGPRGRSKAKFEEESIT